MLQRREWQKLDLCAYIARCNAAPLMWMLLQSILLLSRWAPPSLCLNPNTHACVRIKVKIALRLCCEAVASPVSNLMGGFLGIGGENNHPVPPLSAIKIPPPHGLESYTDYINRPPLKNHFPCPRMCSIRPPPLSRQLDVDDGLLLLLLSLPEFAALSLSLLHTPFYVLPVVPAAAAPQQQQPHNSRSSSNARAPPAFGSCCCWLWRAEGSRERTKEQEEIQIVRVERNRRRSPSSST